MSMFYGQPLINGRVLSPASAFFIECSKRLRSLGFDGLTGIPLCHHPDTALIGHELLLSSEFCDESELLALSRRFHCTIALWYDYIRCYRHDVAAYVAQQHGGETR